MDIAKLTVKELNKKLEKKEITTYEIYKVYMNNILEKDKEIGAFLSLNEYDLGEDKEKSIEEYNLKYNIPIAIKDNIAVKDLKFTCSSKILEEYISPYNASVIEQLKEKGIYVIGKTNLDEFAGGIGTQNSKLLKTLNPLDKTRVPGGTSGGSAAAVAVDFSPWALGTDTGGSARQPAACCGIVGFKPSYGLVSRYGVSTNVSSFDQIGTFTKTVEDTAILMNIISVKKEDKDPNVVVLDKDYTKNLDNDIKGKKVGVVRELINISSNEVKGKMEKAIDVFKNLGVIVEDIDLPYIYETTLIYKILGYADVSSNLERFDGIRYGIRCEGDTYESLIINTRTEGFGTEIKKRIILGSYILQKENFNKYYIKSAKIRRKIVEKLNEIFEKYDAIIMPTAPDVAPKIDELENIDTTNIDKCVMLANITGIPAISIPIDKLEDLPIGLQIMGKQFNDDLVLNIANIYEKNV